MSVAGTRYFGAIDAVPGLFHIATKFFHINYVPLIPLESCVVIANSDHNGPRGQTLILAVKTPINWKSIFIAYLRGVLWVSFVLSAVFLIPDVLLFMNKGDNSFSGFSGQELLGLNVTAIAASALLLYLTYRTTVASRERALELAKIAGFEEQVVLQQLAFDGYPLRSPPRTFDMRNCKACGAHNRGVTNEDGNMTCCKCGAVVGPRRFQWVWIVVVLLAVAIGIALAEYRH